MKRIYAIYDLVSLMIVSAVLHLEVHDAPATRAFHDALGTPNSNFGHHPADFNLVCLGSISELGVITPELGLDSQPCPRVVATGASWLEARSSEATK